MSRAMSICMCMCMSTVVCLQFSFTVNAFLVYSFRLQFTPPVRTAPQNAITTWRPLHT